MNHITRLLSLGLVVSFSLLLAACATTPDVQVGGTAPSPAPAAPATAAPAPAAPAKTSNTTVVKAADVTVTAPVPAPAPVSAVLTGMPKNDDHVIMAQVLNITGDQLAKFQEKVVARNAEYEKWKQTPVGQQYVDLKKQLDDAKKAKDQAKVTELEAKLVPVRKEEQATRAKLRIPVDEVLTLDQQRRWAAYQLCTKILGNELKSAQLTDEQKTKAQAQCEQLAAELVKPDTYKSDPYLKLDAAAQARAVELIKTKVLTPDQK